MESLSLQFAENGKSTIANAMACESFMKGKTDMMKKIKCFCLAAFALLGANAATINVATQTELESALAAVNTGDTISIAAGNYDATAQNFFAGLTGKAVTLCGPATGDKPVLDFGNGLKYGTASNSYLTGAEITFENLEIKFTTHKPGASTFYTESLVHPKAQVYKNVTIVGCICIQDDATFENCTFTGPIDGTSNDYNKYLLWVYSGKATIKGCAFNTGTACPIKLFADTQIPACHVDIDKETKFEGFTSTGKGCLIYTSNRFATSGTVFSINVENGITKPDGVVVVKASESGVSVYNGEKDANGKYISGVFYCAGITDEKAAEIIGSVCAETYAPQKNPDGTYGEEAAPAAPAVAKIGTTEYATLADAVAAAKAGDVVEIVAAGTYTLPNISNNITIKAADGVVFNCEGSGNICAIPNGCTFEGGKFIFGNSAYHGFQHAGTINMNGCELNGLLFSYGDMTFDGCHFVQETAEYCMWLYGKDITFKNCKADAMGKFFNVYTESNDTPYNITADNCEFYSSVAKKAVFNVKETCGTTPLKYNVNINVNCKATGSFPEASESDTLIVFSPLVQVDDRKSTVESAITVKMYEKVGDKEVEVPLYPLAAPAVAKIGETEYATLAEACAAAKSGTDKTIVLLVDEITEGVNSIEEGFTIVGVEGKTAIYDVIGKTLNNVTFKNIRFAGEGNAIRWSYIGNGYTFTAENCDFVQKGAYGVHFDSNSGGKVVLKNCHITGFNTTAGGIEIEIDGCRFGADYNGYSVFQTRAKTVIRNSTFEDGWFAGRPDYLYVGTAGGSSYFEFENVTLPTGKSLYDFVGAEPNTFVTIDPVRNTDGKFIDGTFILNSTDESQRSLVACAEGYELVAVAGRENVYTVAPATRVCQIGDTQYRTVADAVAAVKAGTATGSLVKMIDDEVFAEPVEIDGDVTIDLNGKTITYGGASSNKGVFCIKHGGKLTINDSIGTGKIDGGANIYAAVSVASDTENPNKPAELVVNNGTIVGDYYAIVGNGSENRGNTIITINGGTLCGAHDEDNLAIYHPQVGTLNITGGKFLGYNSAIEMRSGTLNISGGEFEATAAPTMVNPNGSGSTSMGAAIAVAQHGTKNAIAVNITGGTFKGYSAIYESNPEENPAEDIAKVSLAISGGQFVSTATENPAVVYSQDKSAFITGGTYSAQPTEGYIAAGYEAKPMGDWYTVVEAEENVDPEKPVAEAGTIKKEDAIALEEAKKEGGDFTTEVVKDTTAQASENAVKIKITSTVENVKSVGLAKVGLNDKGAKVVTAEIQDAKTTIPQGQTEAELAVDYATLAPGVYQPTLYVKKAGEQGEEVETAIPDPNAASITVLKPTSDQESVIVPVPGDKTAAGGAVSIANVIDNSSLAEGDQIRFYNENGNYDLWTRDANGKWVEGTTVSGQGQTQAKPADEVKLPAGGAFWLTRGENADKTKPVTVIAQTKDVVETPVAAGWNLLANPKAEEIDLDKVCEKVSAADDKIVVPTKGLAQKTYTFKNGKWGYTEYYSENGRVKARRVLASEEKIAPGQGLWYVSGEKKDNKVEWNNK